DARAARQSALRLLRSRGTVVGDQSEGRVLHGHELDADRPLEPAPELATGARGHRADPARSPDLSVVARPLALRRARPARSCGIPRRALRRTPRAGRTAA